MDTGIIFRLYSDFADFTCTCVYVYVYVISMQTSHVEICVTTTTELSHATQTLRIGPCSPTPPSCLPSPHSPPSLTPGNNYHVLRLWSRHFQQCSTECRLTVTDLSMAPGPSQCGLDLLLQPIPYHHPETAKQDNLLLRNMLCTFLLLYLCL